MPTAVSPRTFYHPLSIFTDLRCWTDCLQLILADKYESYDLTYEGCHVFNPGSFVGNQFEWTVYKPYEKSSERRSV